MRAIPGLILAQCVRPATRCRMAASARSSRPRPPHKQALLYESSPGRGLVSLWESRTSHYRGQGSHWATQYVFPSSGTVASTTPLMVRGQPTPRCGAAFRPRGHPEAQLWALEVFRLPARRDLPPDGSLWVTAERAWEMIVSDLEWGCSRSGTVVDGVLRHHTCGGGKRVKALLWQ